MVSKRQARREADTLWRLCLIDSQPEADRSRMVVDRLAHSGRAAATAILREFIRRLRLEDASRTAVVSSAVPLDSALQSRVVGELGRLRGHAISTSFVVDPALIGGMRVKVGNDVYDGTVRAGLAALESRFGSIRR